MDFVTELTIGAFLGRGHFGEVFRGHHPLHGAVAVKTFTRQGGDSDADWIARRTALLREGQLMARAEHSHVVRVHQVVEHPTDDAILLVMDFCPGGSMEAWYQGGPTSLRALHPVLTDVAMGLQVLHLRQMLHRDIKPANILIDGRGRARIADFGLVTDDLLLGYGSTRGYSDHIAFEVWQGSGTSERSDVWAFGMTAYRLMHGAAWYDQLPRPRLTIDQGGFALKLPWLPHVPDAWRRFIRRAMHDDPGSRFQGAGDCLNALAALSISPAWTCKVGPASIEWRREAGDRVQRVKWTMHSARRHEWSAWSEDPGGGGAHTLHRSTVSTSRATTQRELDAFFADRM